MPKVSVIVPNYNHSIYLLQRLDSIFNQTFQDFEVILLDDCSTDDSREILEQYRKHPRVSHIIYNDKNRGTSYKQWYKGIEYAKGELIWIAESDDWCDDRFLETLVAYFKDNQVVIAFSQTHYVYSDEDLQNKPLITGKYEKYKGIEFIRKEMLANNAICNAGMAIFSKQRYEEVKEDGFKKLKLCGDWLLWIQIMLGYKVVFIPEELNYLRRHPTNATNKFRALGLDFLEGLDVLGVGKKYSNNKFNRENVYFWWLDRYIRFKEQFAKGVIWKVYYKMIQKEPKLFLFILYKAFKSNIKTLIYKKN
jgi:glycosyltransferase involved in cell wall biosynthesis